MNVWNISHLLGRITLATIPDDILGMEKNGFEMSSKMSFFSAQEQATARIFVCQDESGPKAGPRGDAWASELRGMAVPGRTCIMSKTARSAGGGGRQAFPGKQQQRTLDEMPGVQNAEHRPSGILQAMRIEAPAERVPPLQGRG